MNDQEALQLIKDAEAAYKCKEPPGSSEDSKSTKAPHTLVSNHEGYQVWECEVNQKDVQNVTTYHYPRASGTDGAIIGLLRCIAAGYISGTDIVSGHRIRRQAEGAVDPEKQLRDAEQKVSSLSVSQKQSLIEKLLGDQAILDHTTADVG